MNAADTIETQRDFDDKDYNEQKIIKEEDGKEIITKKDNK